MMKWISVCYNHLAWRWSTAWPFGERWFTHRHPGTGSDSRHKLSLSVGRLPLDLLEAVQSGREVIQQTLSLYFPLPLKQTQKTNFNDTPKKKYFPLVCVCQEVPDLDQQGGQQRPSSVCQSPLRAGCLAAVSVAWWPKTIIYLFFVHFLWVAEKHWQLNKPP